MKIDRRAIASPINGAKSRGPVTAAGKDRVATNPLRHGLRARRLVLPGVETVEDWEAHLAGVLASLAPANYVERLLAERFAECTWRLRRIAPAEVAVLAEKTAKADRDAVDRELDKPGGARTVAQYQERIDEAERYAAALERAAAGEGGDEDMEVIVNHVGLDPRAREDDPIWSIEKPTLADVTALVARVWRCSHEEVPARLQAAAFLARKSVERWRARFPALEEEAARLSTARSLPETASVETISRYEAHLERAALRALRELHRVQAFRMGEGGVPAALDVEVGFSGPRSEGRDDRFAGESPPVLAAVGE